MKLVNQVLSHLKYRQKQKQSNSDKYSYDGMKSFTGNVITSFIIAPKKKYRNTAKSELFCTGKSLGTDKYNIIIYLNETFGINITNNKVIIASNRETFFEGYNLSADDYFNISLSADILSPDEITKIRNYMKGKKEGHYYIYCTLYTISGFPF